MIKKISNLINLSNVLLIVILIFIFANLFSYKAIATPTFVDSFSVASQETSPQSVAFNADGTKMFV